LLASQTEADAADAASLGNMRNGLDTTGLKAVDELRCRWPTMGRGINMELQLQTDTGHAVADPSPQLAGGRRPAGSLAAG